MKTKTVAKQRYLRAKARRHKITVAARKASAPKDRSPKPTDSRQTPSEIGTREAVKERAISVRNERSSTSSSSSNTAVGEQAPTAKRRRASSSASATSKVSSAGSGSTSDQSQSAGPSTPPALQMFPLPTAPKAPDAPILARQGLPAGLQDALFVEQDRRMRLSEVGEDGRKGLSERMSRRLESQAVTDLFAGKLSILCLADVLVQAAMIPRLLQEELIPPLRRPPRDFLVSAPTGSGKTLAYAVPLVEVLSRRIVIRLRALIVLPTRELVIQVRDVLEMLAEGTDLKIGTATGHQTLSHEQRQIIAHREQSLMGGSSKIDILIATPGRLVDHIESTPNFTLQHLRFLVVDEADRLLNQAYQSWLPMVLSHIYPPSNPVKLDQAPETWDHLAPAWMEAYGLTDLADPLRERPTSSKLLFSATLTRDPAKAAALSLRSPQYVIVQSLSHSRDFAAIGEQFALPDELAERFLVVEPASKPLLLLHLLHSSTHSIRNALIFTKSIESVERLVRLLSFFQDAWTGERLTARSFTADLGRGERKALLRDFEKGLIQILVCSDVAARGIDLPSVRHVISYDAPLDMRKYVHRVGRTARAGRSGMAWTLVEKQEAPRFRATLESASHFAKLQKIRVKPANLEPYKNSYQIAMKRLAEVYGRFD